MNRRVPPPVGQPAGDLGPGAETDRVEEHCDRGRTFTDPGHADQQDRHEDVDRAARHEPEGPSHHRPGEDGISEEPEVEHGVRAAVLQPDERGHCADHHQRRHHHRRRTPQLSSSGLLTTTTNATTITIDRAAPARSNGGRSRSAGVIRSSSSTTTAMMKQTTVITTSSTEQGPPREQGQGCAGPPAVQPHPRPATAEVWLPMALPRSLDGKTETRMPVPTDSDSAPADRHDHPGHQQQGERRRGGSHGCADGEQGQAHQVHGGAARSDRPSGRTGAAER